MHNQDVTDGEKKKNKKTISGMEKLTGCCNACRSVTPAGQQGNYNMPNKELILNSEEKIMKFFFLAPYDKNSPVTDYRFNLGVSDFKKK